MSDESDSTTIRKTLAQAEETAGKLPGLLIEAERVAMSVAQGVHGRRRVGIGESFWQFRPYESTDPVRSIDWRQSAKREQAYVRQMEWEAAQSVFLWRDQSESMQFRSARKFPYKQYCANLLMLALGAMLVEGGEQVALLGTAMPPFRGRTALPRVAEAMMSTPDMPMREVRQMPRHAHVILVSDFWDPPGELRKFMEGLAGRNIRGHMVQVVDPAEVLLPFKGNVRFRGMEGEGEERIPNVESIRDQYRERIEKHMKELKKLADSYQWGFEQHLTHQPVETVLLKLYTSLSQDS